MLISPNLGAQLAVSGHIPRSAVMESGKHVFDV